MVNNTTTPADMAALLANLYADRLLPPGSTETVLQLLQQSVFDDRRAEGVPTGIPVAHKVGTDVGVYNDAGIVLNPKRPYVVAVFSEDATRSRQREYLAGFLKTSTTLNQRWPQCVSPAGRARMARPSRFDHSGAFDAARCSQQ